MSTNKLTHDRSVHGGEKLWYASSIDSIRQHEELENWLTGVTNALLISRDSRGENVCRNRVRLNGVTNALLLWRDPRGENVCRNKIRLLKWR